MFVNHDRDVTIAVLLDSASELAHRNVWGWAWKSKCLPGLQRPWSELLVSLISTIGPCVHDNAEF